MHVVWSRATQGWGNQHLLAKSIHVVCVCVYVCMRVCVCACVCVCVCVHTLPHSVQSSCQHVGCVDEHFFVREFPIENPMLQQTPRFNHLPSLRPCRQGLINVLHQLPTHLKHVSDGLSQLRVTLRDVISQQPRGVEQGLAHEPVLPSDTLD